MIGPFFRPKPTPCDDRATFRRSLALDTLANPEPDAQRLNRAADAALRRIRQSSARDAGFAWMLSPQMAFGLMLMAAAGGMVGTRWPAGAAQASSSTSDVVALLAAPAVLPGSAAQ